MKMWDMEESQKSKEQIAAESFAKDNRTIFADESHVLVGDIGAAQEMAPFEGIRQDKNATDMQKEVAQKGLDEITTKLQTEAYLHGLTEDQKWYEGLIKKIVFDEKGEERNPNAFIRKTDRDGREYWVLHPVPSYAQKEEPYPGMTLVLSLDGIIVFSNDKFAIDGNETLEDIPGWVDWEAFGDKMSKKTDEDRWGVDYIPVWKNGGSAQVRVDMIKLRPSSANLEVVMKAVKFSESRGLAKIKPPRPDPDELLKGLI